MTALIIYDSQFGNTERIARAIARSLGSARVVRAQEAGALDLTACELLVVGGLTQRHAVSAALSELFDRIPRGALAHVPAAAFDTRYRMSAFIAGSAASWIASRLRRSGAHLAAPAESFFIQRDRPPEGQKRRHELETLEPGEEERAAAWARRLIATAKVV